MIFTCVLYAVVLLLTDDGVEEDAATGVGHALDGPDDDGVDEDKDDDDGAQAELEEPDDNLAPADAQEIGASGGAGGAADDQEDKQDDDGDEKEEEQDRAGDEEDDAADVDGADDGGDDIDETQEAKQGQASGRQGEATGAAEGDWQRAADESAPPQGGQEDDRRKQQSQPRTAQQKQDMNPFADPDKALRQWEAHLRELRGEEDAVPPPVDGEDGGSDGGDGDDADDEGRGAGDMGAADDGGVFMLAPVEDDEEPPAPEASPDDDGDDDDDDGADSDAEGGDLDMDGDDARDGTNDGDGDDGRDDDDDGDGDDDDDDTGAAGMSKLLSNKLKTDADGDVDDDDDDDDDGDGDGDDAGAVETKEDDKLTDGPDPAADRALDGPAYAVTTAPRTRADVRPEDVDLEDADVDAMRLRFETAMAEWDTLADGRAGQAHAAWGALSAAAEEQSGHLCESLRLLLDPTLATRLQGDYKTGKRINIRKIIPYIASSFRKDKIWLRRTKPSKRQYHVLLACDNSRSMADTSVRAMACEAMATICKAMAKLEVGDIGVVSFGESVELLHPFGTPFTSDAGARVLSQLSFDQESTRLVETVNDVLGVLDDAKESLRGGAGAGGRVKCLQLAILISDGILGGSDRDRIRQAVLTAASRNQLLCMVIIGNPDSSNSVLATKRVVYSGSRIVGFKTYLEDYPFPFYLVIRDLRELPAALADCLRQWFEAVNQRDEVV